MNYELITWVGVGVAIALSYIEVRVHKAVLKSRMERAERDIRILMQQVKK